MSDQSTFNLSTESKADPVECLGMTFPSEQTRREHFLKLLAEKLKDPEFRKIEGFPIGKDEDILALSDPPYYTACPNPWIGEFVRLYGKPYDPKVPYHREPFAADVSEGKNHPIYNAHSYHTKVPHRAIMRYILHYTEPGDLVFDGFCGTGMTGVAAQLCGDSKEVQELGYRVQEDGTILNEEGKPFSKLGARRAILNDLSPITTLISAVLSNSIAQPDLDTAVARVIAKASALSKDFYNTNHTGWEVRQRKTVEHKQYRRSGDPEGSVEFTVYSDVVACPDCGSSHSFYEVSVDEKNDSLRSVSICPSCKASLKETDWKPVKEQFFDGLLDQVVERTKIVPVLINYTVGKKRFEKIPDDRDESNVNDASHLLKATGFPIVPMIPGKETQRNAPIGISYLHQFFTPLEAVYAGNLFKVIHEEEHELKKILLLGFTAMIQYVSRMRRFRADRKGGGPLSGTLYVSSLITPLNVLKSFRRNIITIQEALYSKRRLGKNLV